MQGQISFPARQGANTLILKARKLEMYLHVLSPAGSDTCMCVTCRYQRDLPMGFDLMMENMTDPAHVPQSHHGVIVGSSGDSWRMYCSGDLALAVGHEPSRAKIARASAVQQTCNQAHQVQYP